MILSNDIYTLRMQKVKKALRHLGTRQYKQWCMLMGVLKEKMALENLNLDLSGGFLHDIPKENMPFLLKHQSLVCQIAKCEYDVEFVKDIISYGYKFDPKIKDDLKTLYECIYIYGIRMKNIGSKLNHCTLRTANYHYRTYFYKIILELKRRKITMWENKNGNFIMNYDDAYFHNYKNKPKPQYKLDNLINKSDYMIKELKWTKKKSQ